MTRLTGHAKIIREQLKVARRHTQPVVDMIDTQASNDSPELKTGLEQALAAMQAMQQAMEDRLKLDLEHEYPQ
ncbi:MAG TPA: hypothetical protein ENK34_10650 [Rhodobacteraceae bacterium]|nr:hypothetical protein [Paracoccaceae bacterium]